MVDVRDLRSVVDAAEQAAAAGNHALAEQLLREAAILQEATLGPLHPDLANTLNNLGVVCEILGKAADAEHSYRRAYAIAKAVLEPNHPFVATSGKNLRDFCETRGIPIESPALPPVAAAEPEKRVPAAVPLRGERPSGTESQRSARRFPPAAIALAVGALAIVVLIVARGWFSADEPPESTPASVTQSPEPKPPAESPAPAPAPVPPPVAPGRVPDDTTAKSPVAAPASAPPIVAEAEVCRTLSTGGDWRCDPASSPVDPGTLFFYTRLKSATDTTVQHRWYRGDRLHQAVALQIRANQSNGFRTFSRQTVNAQTVGDWRVELRDATGNVLHERRIVVR